MNIEKNQIVLKYYQIQRKLGQGAFGCIYLARNIKDDSKVALKVQSSLSKKSQLLYQSRVIIDLKKSLRKTDINLEQINIPKVYNFGKQGDNYVMVIDYLGPSLQQLFIICGRKFSIKTTVIIGLDMLKLIKYVHDQGMLHRDIKPDNFLIGVKSNINKIYMIDFGLAKRYLTKDEEHIPYRDNKDLTGTARYASVNTHLGIQQGRRDDLQSFVYVLIYFLRGSLPWQSMKGQGKKEKYEKIMEKKLTFSISYLTEGLPKEIEQMLSYVRCLHFKDQPNYDYLFSKLISIVKRQEINLQNRDFDWMKVVKKKASQKMQEKIQQS